MRRLRRLPAKLAWRARLLFRLSGRPRRIARDFSMAVPFAYPVEAEPRLPSRIAAICHVFYPDLAGEVFSALCNIPGPADVFISTDTESKREAIAAVFAGWSGGAVDLRIVPNRGRDVAGKLVVFADSPHRYDYLLYLHTKRDSHLRDGSAWRRFLFGTLAGSPAIVASVLAAFEADPALGILFPQHWRPMRPWIGWTENFGHAQRVARRLGFALRPRDTMDFPSGSMFWARGAAMRPLIDLGLSLEDFPPEPLPDDGTLLHALERLVLFACEAAGYRWAKIARPDLPGLKDTMVPIRGPDDVRRFGAEHGLHLVQDRRRV